MARKKRGLAEGKLPLLLLQRVQRGELRTRSEWAKMFNITPSHLGMVLNTLRKRNFMLYPVGKTGNKEGVIRDVSKHIKDFRETNERLANNYVNPNILASFRLLETYLLEDPNSAKEIEVRANKLLMMVMSHKELLLEERNKNGTT